MKAKTTTASRKPAPKHARLKIALIPVLLLVLAYVVFAPTDAPVTDNVPTTDSPGPSPVAAIASAVQSPAGAGAPAKGPVDSSAWPEVSLKLLASSNPFASLVAETEDSTVQHFVSANAQPANAQPTDEGVENVDHLADVASELERRPVNFVFRSTKQNVIMLGDEILAKGTHLSPAVQLHDIGDHALLLKLRP